MDLGDYKIFFPSNDFHLEVTVHGVDDVEFVDYGCDALRLGFGEDDLADVVFVGETGSAKVHVADVAYCCEATGNILDFWG